MSDGTAIEWTDATWNIITGCSVTSPGCTNCYAMRLAGSGRAVAQHPSRVGLTTPSKAGAVWNGQVRFNGEWLRQPLHWKRPRKIFVCAHGDLFHEAVPDEWIDQVFAVMALCSQHVFQVLTKRSTRMRGYLSDIGQRVRVSKLVNSWPTAEIGTGNEYIADVRLLSGEPLPNVWLGVSVEDQQRANERIPDLLATPAAVRWLSMEPLLGPVDLESAWHGENALDSECWGSCNWCRQGADYPPLHNCQSGLQTEADRDKMRSGLDWIVLGGESGAGARPMHPDWARDIRDQCASAGVPFLFKQWGEWGPGECGGVRLDRGYETASWFDERWDFDRCGRSKHDDHIDDEPDLYRCGKSAAGRHLDGVLHDGFPGTIDST